MTLLKFFFWLSFLILIYSYIGYGLVMWLLVRIKRIFTKSRPDSQTDTDSWPEVTIVISAFNEEDFIEKKIENSFRLDYPGELLKIICITDGSTDRTPEIVSRFPRIRLMHQAPRQGKSAAMNRAIQEVGTEIVIFSDANTLLNPGAVRAIVRHYKDPLVGGVAGEKKILTSGDTNAAGAGEGFYWKYESFLKKLDSELYSVVGAAGELFSLRTALFEPLGNDVIIEDFVQSLRICLRGYTVRYEPDAYAMETSSASMKEEEKRKIRICAGGFQAMVMLKQLFNIFKYPVLSFQYISHRILRWTICPLALIVMFLANVALVLAGAHPVYRYLLILQLCFYLFALLGKGMANRNMGMKVFYIPYYFLFMNVAVFAGFYRFVYGKQSSVWEKAARQKLE